MGVDDARQKNQITTAPLGFVRTEHYVLTVISLSRGYIDVQLMLQRAH